MGKTVERHGFVTRWTHWVCAALIGFGYLKGSDEVAQQAHPSSLQFEVVFALGIGLLFAVRLIWVKAFAGSTRLTDNAPKWEQIASRVFHGGLYASAFGIVLSCLAIAFISTSPIFGSATLALAIGLHEISLGLLLVLPIAHVAGAF